MRTSIIIPNWNTRELTLRCLRSVRLHTQEPHEIVLVDNGSRDGSPVAFAAAAGPGLRLVLLPENLGFAAGCNRGIAEATGEVLCLLNSDARVTQGWLPPLLRELARPGVGLAGPYTDHAKRAQRRRPWFGRFPPPWRRSRTVPTLSFFCVLISRQVIERVGLLDERFGLGTFEDDDYCRRAREAGFLCRVAGPSWVWHDAHATFRANALDADLLQAENARLFAAKWTDPPA
jgi:GT2 family glycosyltransferase